MNEIMAGVSAMMAPLTAQLARSQGWRDGYREGANWTVTMLLDRACNIQDEGARRIVQGLAREILNSLQHPPEPPAEKPASEAVQPVGTQS